MVYNNSFYVIHCRSASMATARDKLHLNVPLKTAGDQERDSLLQYIEKGQVGFDATLQGPYGTRKGVYIIIIIYYIHVFEYITIPCTSICPSIQCV